MDDLFQIDIAIVAFNNICLGLDGTDDAVHLSQLVLRYFGGFVQQDDVAELNLLDDQILNILLIDVLTQQIVTATELVTHTQGIDYRHDTVKLQIAILHVFRSEGGNVNNGLCDGSWLANTAGLDDDIVKTLHGRYVT